MSTQKHKGSGDNVAGNKVINILWSFKFKYIILLLIVGLGLILSIVFIEKTLQRVEKGEQKQNCEKIFAETSNINNTLNLLLSRVQSIYEIDWRFINSLEQNVKTLKLRESGMNCQQFSEDSFVQKTIKTGGLFTNLNITMIDWIEGERSTLTTTEIKDFKKKLKSTCTIQKIYCELFILACGIEEMNAIEATLKILDN